MQTTILELPSEPAEWAPRPDYNKRHTFQAPAAAPAPAARQDQPRRSFQQPVHREYNQASIQAHDYPPTVQVAREQLDRDFKNHLTSYDNISSSLDKSPYELALAIPKQRKPVANERAKSMTAQFEADAAARFARSRTVSQESQASTIMRPRRSYDSVSNGNPFKNECVDGSRVSSREVRGPPQAHANGRRPYSLIYSTSRESLPSYRNGVFEHGDEHFPVDELRWNSASPYGQKAKLLPPVSKKAQELISDQFVTLLFI
jgi:hypothetical protein